VKVLAFVLSGVIGGDGSSERVGGVIRKNFTGKVRKSDTTLGEERDRSKEMWGGVERRADEERVGRALKVGKGWMGGEHFSKRERGNKSVMAEVKMSDQKVFGQTGLSGTIPIWGRGGTKKNFDGEKEGTA